MTPSMIKWHVARDNNSALARFCEKNKVRTEREFIGDTFFAITYTFDNGGYIKAKMLRGTKDKGYSIADMFHVLEKGWGSDK